MIKRGVTITQDNLNRAFLSKIAQGMQILKGSIRVLGSIQVDGQIIGTAFSANELETPRSIAMTGDGTWTVNFDGSANVSATMTLANSGVTAGTWTKVTVDSKGRVTTGANMVEADVPALNWAKITSGKPTTLAGYGITDAAPLASPALTGNPTAPTQVVGTNNTRLATTAFVQATVNALINGAPGALDTLIELAEALGNDPDFAATVTNQLALKAPIANPVFTGTVTIPRAAITNSTGKQVSAYQWADMSSNTSGHALFANNAYTDGASNWRYAQTHASLGARGIRMSVSGGIEMFNTGSVATTAGATFTPVWVKIGNANIDDIRGVAHPLNLLTNRGSKDSEGIFTVVERRRVNGGDLILYDRSILSGGTSPQYTTRTVTRYDDAGLLISTTVYDLSYDSDGDLITESLST